MRPILAYSNKALPETADEGQVFINISTEESFVYTKGSWQPKDRKPQEPEPPKEDPVLSKEDPVLSKEDPILPKEPKAAAPKKKTTTKKAPKKEEAE